MAANPQPASPSATRELLRRYLARWAGWAVAGSAPDDAALPPEVLFVDAFAGTDYPRPAPRGALAAEVAARLRERRGGAGTRAVLLEEDPAKVEWLRGALRGLSLREDDALQLREDDGSALPGLAANAADAHAALLLLDPPAAARLPMERLHPWLALPHAELLIRFPVADLRRLARYQGSTLADLPPFAKRAVDGLSVLLGGGRRDWVFPWRAALEQGEAVAEAAVIATYVARLRERSGRIVRHLAVAPDGCAAEHLLLVTRDPARALHLNDLLHEARHEGWLPWPETGAEGVRYEADTSLSLFAGAAAPGPLRRVVDRAAVANSLAERFAGRSLAWERLLAELVDGELLLGEIRRALADLRRDGRALYRSLGGGPIAFPRTGSRLRGAPARPGRQGAGGDGLRLDLGGE